MCLWHFYVGKYFRWSNIIACSHEQIGSRYTRTALSKCIYHTFAREWWIMRLEHSVMTWGLIEASSELLKCGSASLECEIWHLLVRSHVFLPSIFSENCDFVLTFPAKRQVVLVKARFLSLAELASPRTTWVSPSLHYGQPNESLALIVISDSLRRDDSIGLLAIANLPISLLSSERGCTPTCAINHVHATDTSRLCQNIYLLVIQLEKLKISII